MLEARLVKITLSKNQVEADDFVEGNEYRSYTEWKETLEPQNFGATGEV